MALRLPIARAQGPSGRPRLLSSLSPSHSRETTARGSPAVPEVLGYPALQDCLAREEKR